VSRDFVKRHANLCISPKGLLYGTDSGVFVFWLFRLVQASRKGYYCAYEYGWAVIGFPIGLAARSLTVSAYKTALIFRKSNKKQKIIYSTCTRLEGGSSLDGVMLRLGLHSLSFSLSTQVTSSTSFVNRGVPSATPANRYHHQRQATTLISPFSPNTSPSKLPPLFFERIFFEIRCRSQALLSPCRVHIIPPAHNFVVKAFSAVVDGVESCRNSAVFAGALDPPADGVGLSLSREGRQCFVIEPCGVLESPPHIH
jgi:hypothetical protein